MSVDFKPSEVVLGIPLPLIGCFKHAESEVMAAMMIRALVRNGDSWGPVPPRMVGEAMRSDIEEKVPHVKTMLTNPFMRPHPHLLVEEGFAEWTAPEGADDRPLVFTAKAFEILSKLTRQEGAGQ